MTAQRGEPAQGHFERASSGAGHSLRYRVVDSGTLYDCECGDFTEAANPTDEDHRRVYEAHAAHIRAASGADRDVCACGHDVTDHGTGPVGCIHRDGCAKFTCPDHMRDHR